MPSSLDLLSFELLTFTLEAVPCGHYGTLFSCVMVCRRRAAVALPLLYRDVGGRAGCTDKDAFVAVGHGEPVRRCRGAAAAGPRRRAAGTPGPVAGPAAGQDRDRGRADTRLLPARRR